MSDDRTVHGVGADDLGDYEVVRYDRSGKWHVEYDGGKHGRQVTVAQAVAATHRAYLRRPGGGAFDSRWRCRAENAFPAADAPETSESATEERGDG